MNEAARGGARSPDVIVVGGVTGTSIAWRLAQEGHRVPVARAAWHLCRGFGSQCWQHWSRLRDAHGAEDRPPTAYHHLRESSALEIPPRRTGQGFRAQAPGEHGRAHDARTDGACQRDGHHEARGWERRRVARSCDRPLDHALPLTPNPGRNLYARSGTPLAVRAGHRNG